METVKSCTKCKKEYPIEHFNKKGSGRNTRCKVCVSEYYRNYYHGSEERKAYVKAASKANKEKNKFLILAKKYSSTPLEIESLFKLHDGKCHICMKNDATDVDHCHATGAIRGALCSSCNRGIGLLGDNTESLLKAYKYLAAVSPLADNE